MSFEHVSSFTRNGAFGFHRAVNTGSSRSVFACRFKCRIIQAWPYNFAFPNLIPVAAGAIVNRHICL